MSVNPFLHALASGESFLRFIRASQCGMEITNYQRLRGGKWQIEITRNGMKELFQASHLPHSHPLLVIHHAERLSVFV